MTPSAAFTPASTRRIGGQDANVAQSLGDNGRNREHHVARCRTVAPDSPMKREPSQTCSVANIAHGSGLH